MKMIRKSRCFSCDAFPNIQEAPKIDCKLFQCKSHAVPLINRRSIFTEPFTVEVQKSKVYEPPIIFIHQFPSLFKLQVNSKRIFNFYSFLTDEQRRGNISATAERTSYGLCKKASIYRCCICGNDRYNYQGCCKRST